MKYLYYGLILFYLFVCTYASDCLVSEWSSFGSCSAVCGGGVTNRYRSVISRRDANSENSCPSLIDSKICNSDPCFYPDETSLLSCDRTVVSAFSSLNCLIVPKFKGLVIQTNFSYFSLKFSGIGTLVVPSIYNFGDIFNFQLILGDNNGYIFTLSDGISSQMFTFSIFGIPDHSSTLNCSENMKTNLLIGQELVCKIYPKRLGIPIYTLASLFSPFVIPSNAGFISEIEVGENNSFKFKFFAGMKDFSSVSISDSISSLVSSFEISSSGVIRLEGGYEPLQNKTWIIKPAISLSGLFIQFTLRWIDIEIQIDEKSVKNRTACNLDYLAIFADGNRLAQLCGTTRTVYNFDASVNRVENVTVKANFSNAIVNFVSDKNNQGRGFELTYTFVPFDSDKKSSEVPRKLDYILTNSSGTISFLDYQNLDNVRWVIASSFKCSRIDVKFSYFEVEDHSTCSLDYLELWDKNEINGTHIATLCGDNKSGFHSAVSPQIFGKNKVFSAYSGKFELDFFADKINTLSGFIFSYSVWIPVIKINPDFKFRTFNFFYNTNFVIDIPRSIFLNLLELKSVSFSVSMKNGDNVPSFIDFNSELLQISGFIPNLYSSDMSLILKVTTDCGYFETINVPVLLSTRVIPDETSNFFCSNTSIVLSGTNVPKILCTLLTQRNGQRCFVSREDLVPTIISGDGSISEFSSNSLTDSNFHFYFSPLISGGITVLGIAIVANDTITRSIIKTEQIIVYGTPDASTYIGCNDTTVSPNDIIDCFIIPKILRSPCYTRFPFSLGIHDLVSKGSLFPPYIISTPWNSGAKLYPISTYSDSNIFKFQVLVGNQTGVYKISAGNEVPFDIIAVETPDLTSYLSCGSRFISQNSPISCCIYPMKSYSKIYAKSADFMVFSDFGYASNFENTMGTKFCFNFFVSNEKSRLRNLISLSFKVKMVKASDLFVKILESPDLSSTLNCPRSASVNSRILCVFTPKVANISIFMPYLSTVPVILSGQASILSFTRNINDYSFLIPVIISSHVSDVVLFDDVSKTIHKIVVHSEITEVNFLDCPYLLYVEASTKILCTFNTYRFGDTTSAFANLFNISILSNLPMGSLFSAIKSVNVKHVSKNFPSNLFSFEFVAPPKSVSFQWILTYKSFAKRFSLLVYENADDSSSFSCATKNVPAYSSVTCTIFPRLNGVSIFSHSSYFVPEEIKSYGIFSKIYPVAGKILFFTFTPSISHRDIEIKVDVLRRNNIFKLKSENSTSNSSFLLRSYAPGKSIAWSNPLFPSFDTRLEKFKSAYTLFPTNVASRVTGFEVYRSASCSQQNCLLATVSGDVILWNMPEISVNNKIRVVRELVEGLFIKFVCIITAYPFESEEEIFVAISNVGRMFIWGSSYSNMIEYHDSKIVWNLLSNKGGIALAATIDNHVYSLGVNSSAFFLGRSGISNYPSIISFPNLLGNITSLVTSTNYAIVVTVTSNNDCMFYSWGSGLENSFLPSSVLPVVYNFSEKILKLFPKAGNQPCVHAIDGSATGILVVENECSCLNTKICPRGSRLFWLQLEYKHEKINNWNIVENPIDNFNPELITVGLKDALVKDNGGAIFLLPLFDNARVLKLLPLYSGSNAVLLYSYFFQFISVTAPEVFIEPKFDPSNCGVFSFNCPKLSLALTKFKMIGTVFKLSKGLHYDHDILSDTSDVQIRSLDGLKNETIIHCESRGCFKISGSNIVISDVSIQNGSSSSGGCLFVSSNTKIEIMNVNFFNCFADKGGALFSSSGTNMLISNSIFESNIATSKGGSLFLNSGSFIVAKSNFLNGNSNLGGAIFVNSSTVLLFDLLVSQNNAINFGGGIFAENSMLHLINSSIINNFAVSGGGLYLQKSTVLVNISTVDGNNALIDGGGIFIGFTSLNIQSSTISRNIITGGADSSGAGLICVGGKSLHVENSKLLLNKNTGKGGAISVSFCSLNLSNSLIYNNSAFHGGSVFVGLKSNAKILASVFRSNRAFMGGAILFQHSSKSSDLNSLKFSDISDSIFEGNIATQLESYSLVDIISKGGAICFDGRNDVTLRGVTFLSNSADSGGAFWWNMVYPLESNVTYNSNFALHGAIKASDIHSLQWQKVFSKDIFFSSDVASNLTETVISVKLIDFYGQIVSGESSTSAKMISADMSVGSSLVGTTISRFKNGVAIFNNWGISRIPNSVGGITVEGYFPTIGILSTLRLNVSVQACTPGSYVQSNIRCFKCSEGSFSNATMATICSGCNSGYYQPNKGMTSCLKCLPGYFSSYNRAICIPCSAGTYSRSIGSSGCSSCQPGYFSASRNQTFCSTCSAGYYSNSDSQSSCNICPPGKFSNNTASTICSSCTLGKYQSLAGQTYCDFCMIKHANCSNCGPGFVPSSSVDASSCTRCTDGTFASLNGECLSCTQNSQSLSDLSACICKPTFYAAFSSDGSEICLPCPRGANCTLPGTLKSTVVPIVNFFPDITWNNLTYIECVNSACNAEKSTNFCADGYTGNLCTRCQPNYSRVGMFECAKCPDPISNRIKILGFALLLFAFTAFIVFSAVTQSKKELQTVLLRIVANAIQYNALAAGINVEWPTAVNAFIISQRSMSELAASFISLDCFLSVDISNAFPAFYIRSIFMAILPLFVFVVPLVGLVPKYLWDCRKINNLRSNRTIDEFDRALRMESLGRATIKHYLTALIVLLFLLHPSLVSMTLFVFACKQIGPSSNDWYLLGDLTQQCYTPEYYKFAVGLGLPCLILYCFGIPVFFFEVLYRCKPEKKSNHQVSKVNNNVVLSKRENRVLTNFLQSGYRPLYYYWEIIVMIRKTLLIFVVVYFNSYPLLQLLSGSLVTIISLLLHLRILPYTVKTMNRFETFSLVTSFVIFYFGQFIISREVSTGLKIFFGSVILITFISFFFGALIFVVLIILRNRRRVVARENGKKMGKPGFDDEDDDDEKDNIYSPLTMKNAVRNLQVEMCTTSVIVNVNETTTPKHRRQQSGSFRLPVIVGAQVPVTPAENKKSLYHLTPKHWRPKSVSHRFVTPAKSPSVLHKADANS